MFGRSHHSKNSGGASAFSSHLFNRRPQLSKPTSSRASDNHAQSVAATSPSGSGAARGYDAYDDVSPVRLVSVRRNAEQTTRQLDNVEGGDGTRVRRTKLGLSVAVVRGPSTMYSAGLSDTCTLSTDGRRDESEQLRSVSDSRHSSNDSSVSVASASASASLPDSNDAREYNHRRRIHCARLCFFISLTLFPRFPENVTACHQTSPTGRQ